MSAATRINHLTDAHREAMRTWADKWMGIGLSTEAADRPRAEAAVREMYKVAGIPFPPRVIWVQSDIAGGLAAMLAERVWRAHDAVGDAVHRAVDGAVRAAVHGAVNDAVGNAVDGAVNDAVGGAVSDAVHDAVDGAVHGAVHGAVRDAVDGAVDGNGTLPRGRWHGWYGGQWWSGWAAYSSFMGDALGVKLPTRCFDELAASAGHVWPNRNFVMICERASDIRRDERGRLHSDAGMALCYRDGWGLWMIHGVRVTRQIVEAPQTMTVKQISSETNVEVRRIMIERYGPGKYLAESHARVLDVDGGLRVKGGAPRALMEDSGGQRWLVGTDGSTRRVYHMPVPREANTCSQAHSMIAGFDESLIQVES